MVTVENYHVRKTKEGKPFISLELTGDLEMVQSSKNGKFYATMKRCFISSTFNETVAQRMIGKQMPGRIVKEASEPYDYTLPETGEVIQLTHRYGYLPEERNEVVMPTVLREYA